MDANVLKGKIPFIFKQGLTRNHLPRLMLYSLCFTYILCFCKAMGEKMYKPRLGKKGEKENPNTASDVGFCHLLLQHPQQIHGCRLMCLWYLLVLLRVKCR